MKIAASSEPSIKERLGETKGSTQEKQCAKATNWLRMSGEGKRTSTFALHMSANDPKRTYLIGYI